MWTETDRATRKIEVLPAKEFVETLCENLAKLKPHDFIAKQQSAFLRHKKETIQQGEFIVMCDFAENYSFIAQNAIQKFHWRNDQCGIFTIVYYYKNDGVLQHGSIVILSDDLKHNTVAFHSNQKIITDFLKSKFKPTKNFYFTDGAAQHFKNKFSFANLLKHKEDFGIPAEHHFFATFHGKGPCDGLGDALKRGAARASLQRPATRQILSHQALFEWATENMPDTKIYISKKTDNEAAAILLKKMFDAASTVKGTLKYHFFLPSGSGQLKLKRFSMSDSFDLFPKIAF